MRATTDHIEKFRVKQGLMGTDKSMGFNGAFFIPKPNTATIFKVVVSDGGGWEHVSVSLPTRCPTWEEMCYVKSLFWTDDEAVMQLHPPKSEYVNNVRFCLHLWRPTEATIPLPPKIFVGDQSLGTIS